MWINFTGFLARNRAAVPLPYSCCCCYCCLFAKQKTKKKTPQKANKRNQTREPANTAWHTSLRRGVVKWSSLAQPQRPNTTTSQSPPWTKSCPLSVQCCRVKTTQQQQGRSHLDKNAGLSHHIDGPNNFALDIKAMKTRM